MSASSEHPNAALVRRLFTAFGRDAKQVSATLARDVVWRVPGETAMSGEYRGRRDVVEFLRRTGLETDGTYRATLKAVFADDGWALAVYRAQGRRDGRELDIDQVLVIRLDGGLLADITAVPLDPAFHAFWA